MINLLKLFSVIEKHYPEVALPEVREYCVHSESINKPDGLAYGYNSLKWALAKIGDSNPGNASNVLRDILFEHIARKRPFNDLQYKIRTYAAMYPYKDMPGPDWDTLELEQIEVDEFQIILNETSQNITKLIFKNTKADGIIFHNPYTKAAGYIFRAGSKLNKLAGLKQYLIAEVNKIESGWHTVGDDINLIINHGAPNDTPSKLNAVDLLLKMNNYFNTQNQTSK